MKHTEREQSGTEFTDVLLMALHEENYNDIIEHIEGVANIIGQLPESKAYKIALAGFTFLEMVRVAENGEKGSVDIDVPIILKALDDSAEFDRIVEQRKVGDDK